MKGRIRITGEIINVSDYATIALDYCDSYGKPIECKLDDIELLRESTDNIDWEQRRYEIAKSAIQGMWANSEKQMLLSSCKQFAEMACRTADALIAELKKET